MEFAEGCTRTEILNYQNNVHEHIVDSIYAMCDIYLQPNVQINFMNNTFYNVSGLYGGAFISNTGFVTMINNSYTFSSNFGFDAVALNQVSGALIDGFTIDNVISKGSSSEYFFF